MMQIATHSGPFHADDVLATAVLLSLFPEAEVLRSRDQSELDKADIVYDVGQVYDHSLGRYDHHQKGRGGERENGIYYSALGLIWKHYGLEWCDNDEGVWQYIDESLVQYIDADDNGQDLFQLNELGIAPVTLGSVLTNWFRPNYGERQDFDGRFMEAVECAQSLLERYKKRVQATLKAERDASMAYEASQDKRVLVLDSYIPLGRAAERMPELLYKVYPEENTNRWRLEAIPKAKGSFESKRLLPEHWAGLSGEEFVRVSGVEDAVFCHNARFIAGAESKEGALRLLEQALSNT